MMQLSTGFIDFNPAHAEPTASGMLDRLRFAVKDVIDVQGCITGFGHPHWYDTHTPALRHADCLGKLLAQGGELVGKTHTDELTYSLAGQNAHYGTPPNPAVPGASPGGSSSGSASVVAAGLTDFAIGTDTGGSVRVPASFCGLYGFRPSHGAVSRLGVIPLAESFDTIGWFAREAEIMRKVGGVLLVDQPHPQLTTFRLIAEVMDSLDEQLSRQFHDWLAQGNLGLASEEAASLGPLDAYLEAFRPWQAFEAWQHHGGWLQEHRPTLGPGISERFDAASRVTLEMFDQARQQGTRLRQHLASLMRQDTVLCLPTTPSSALRTDASPAQVDAARHRMMCMTAVAGIAGLPQISLPVLRDEGGPVGLSLIGPPGSDMQLLKLAACITAQQPSVSAT